MARSRVTGPFTHMIGETDGHFFIPAWSFMFDVGTWTLTRGAQGNYFMRKTAAANSPNPSVDLGQILWGKVGSDPLLKDPGAAQDPAALTGPGIHQFRGAQITSIDVIYAIGTAALTSQAATLNQTVYVNNTAPAVTQPSTLTGTLATATQAQPYLTNLVVATPYVLGNNVADSGDYFELEIVAALTTVYDLYGIFVNFSYNIL